MRSQGSQRRGVVQPPLTATRAANHLKYLFVASDLCARPLARITMAKCRLTGSADSPSAHCYAFMRVPRAHLRHGLLLHRLNAHVLPRPVVGYRPAW